MPYHAPPPLTPPTPGPVGTQENYDLSVFGDVNVGVSQDVDLDAIAPSLVVEGAITTAKLVFRDSGLIDDGSPNFNLKRKLLQVRAARESRGPSSQGV